MGNAGSDGKAKSAGRRRSGGRSDGVSSAALSHWPAPPETLEMKSRRDVLRIQCLGENMQGSEQCVSKYSCILSQPTENCIHGKLHHLAAGYTALGRRSATTAITISIIIITA